MEEYTTQELLEIMNDESADRVDRKFAKKMLYGNCRNCGKDIEREILRKKAICPYCKKKSALKKPREVHIVFSRPTKTIVEQEMNSLGKEIGIDYQTFYIEKILDYGRLDYEYKLKESDSQEKALKILEYKPLNELKPDIIDSVESQRSVEQRFAYKLEFISPEKEEEMVSKTLKKLQALNKKTYIYLWYNEDNANSYLNFLWFGENFKKFENVYAIKLKNRIKKSELNPFERMKKLTEQDLCENYAKFLEIAQNNSGIRVSKNGKIKCYTVDDVKGLLINCMSQRYCLNGVLYKNFTKTYTEFKNMGLMTFSYVLLRMWIEGLVECNRSFIDVFSSFRIAKQKKKPLTILDTMCYVSVAIEDNNCVDLFKNLADNAVYYSQATNKTISGKNAIIDYILSVGYQFECAGQKVRCNAFVQTDKKHSYAEEDMVLILDYESGESVEVKIDFEKNKITKISLVDFNREGEYVYVNPIVDREIINVCFGDSECGAIKAALKNRKVVNIFMPLEIGNISAGANKHKAWLNNALGGDFFEIEKSQKQIKQIVQKAKTEGYPIRVWLSENPASWCGFYNLVSELKDAVAIISVVDISKTTLKSKYSWGLVNTDDIIKMVETETQVVEGEQQDIVDKWRRLKSENGSLRILKNGEIENVKIDYFDKVILSNVSLQGFSREKLFARVVNEKWEDVQNITEYIFDYRVNELILQGKLIEKNNKIFLV